MVTWDRYAEAYKAIFEAVELISSRTTEITKHEFTWDAAGNMIKQKVYKGADLLFTLTYEWNPEGTLKSVTRS